jgi:hypothetical protein
VNPLLEAVQHLLDAPLNSPGGLFCPTCAAAGMGTQLIMEQECPWCEVPVDQDWAGHHRLDCPYHQLKRAAERATINNPPPPHVCCMARECPTGPDGSRVDCRDQSRRRLADVSGDQLLVELLDRLGTYPSYYQQVLREMREHLPQGLLRGDRQ